ncbi:MAG: hypothetical protein ABI576_00180 [Flavobacterium sp.]
MKKIIIAILLLLTASCKSQTENITDRNKTKTMEKFNTEKYKNLPINPETGLQILPNGDDVEILKGSNNKGFVERINKANTPYIFFKSFYDNGNLQAEGVSIYGTIINKHKEFDEKGHLIKEIDYNKDYKFSIEDLQKKMKETYNVDIMNTKQTRSVSRTTIDTRIKFPYYQVVVNTGKASFNNYLLNGNTGEIFYKIEIIRGDERDVIDEYIKTLKK